MILNEETSELKNAILGQPDDHPFPQSKPGSDTKRCFAKNILDFYNRPPNTRVTFHNPWFPLIIKN